MQALPANHSGTKYGAANKIARDTLATKRDVNAKGSFKFTFSSTAARVAFTQQRAAGASVAAAFAAADRAERR